MKLKKAGLLAVTALAGTMILGGCSGKKATETSAPAADTAKTEAASEAAPENAELPTITFTHGYYQSDSEWPVAGMMRQIYQDFADAHKDEYNFVIKADESGAEGIYNTALNDLSGGEFYDIADFGGWDIVPVAKEAGMILDLKPYLDEDKGFQEGVGVCYDQNLTEDGKIYSVREQIEAVGFWYNEKLFADAGADTPDQWQTWADFDAAVDQLNAAGIVPFGLNAGWPANILTAGYSQRDETSRAFYADGKTVTSFDDPSFKGTMEFMQTRALQKIDATNFGPGGDDDEQYRTDFFAGKTAILFNGVWDAGGTVDCEAGAENIKPAVFPTDEAGKKAALLSGGTGFVISSRLDEAQTKACIDFVKYMTSPEIAGKIVAQGIGMAPSNSLDYDKLLSEVESPEGKLLVEACQLAQKAEYPVLGLGNTFGDAEGEIAGKYAGLKDGSKTPDDVAAELDAFLAAAE